ncbi:ankyrin [Apiospora kogelbergensis]|uniref:Ankyrin n=1 Tax=Apiospora kogelbergensis TaxID=1337665 RepID=A0AAW0QFA3_9PEZI
MASSLTIRTANDPKDFSLWDPHKDTFRQLFLADGLSLAAVKAKMESEYSFPTTNVKTYEWVLREHFKFRKKLEAGQWLLVDRELGRLKQHGLDGDVYVSGKLQDKKHVLKNIQRERRETTSRRPKPNKPTELPTHVEIKPKTGLNRPATQVLRDFVADREGDTSLMLLPGSTTTEANALAPLLEQPASHHQVLTDNYIMDEAILQQIMDNPIGTVYERLKENVPSKSFIRFFRSLWESGRLSADEKTRLSRAMYGLLFMITSYKPSRDFLECFLGGQSLSQPRVFGVNDSVAFLETACVQFSNGEYSIDVFQQPIVRWILDVADLKLLRDFFQLENPTVAALWSNIYKNCILANNKAAQILLRVALDIHRGNWLRSGSMRHLAAAILTGDEDTAERIMVTWQTAIGHKKLTNLTEIVTRCLASQYSQQHKIPLQDLDDALGRLISNSNRHHVAAIDWLLRIITTCSKLMSIFVPAWGCVIAARSGKVALQQFINSLDDYTPQELNRLQQVALSEVAGQGDTETTSILMNAGVDPETKLLPRVEWDANDTSKPRWCYLDPLSRASMTGNLDILNVLINYGFYRLRHIVDALVAAARSWVQLVHFKNRPPAGKKQAATVAFLLKQDPKAIWDKLTDMKAIPCQSLILRWCPQQLDAQVLASHSQPSGPLYSIFPHDTLRTAVKHGCSQSVIESLISADETIHSNIDESGNTLLIDALLSESHDRYQTVHFLLQKGADPCVNGLRLTTLEATLRRYANGFPTKEYYRPHDLPMNNREDRNVSLDLFQELLGLGAPVNRDTTHQEPCPKTLLELLIEYNAGLSLIQRVVSAGANINERHAEQISTPLNTAVITGQLEVATWLVKQGAEVNTKGTSGCYIAESIESETILTNACGEKTNLSFVRLLLEAGADVNPKDAIHSTPLSKAIFQGNMDIVILLLAHGANVNHPIEEFDSAYPVDLAALFGELDILKVLLDSGGGSIYPGNSGFDKAFYNAYVEGHNGILMFLEQHAGHSASTVISNLNALGVPKEHKWWYNSNWRSDC